MPIPRIRGTQLGLRDAALVDTLKGQMRSGTFDFEELAHRIGGVRDRKGTYHVIDGHHRMVAALELWEETRETMAVLELLRCGRISLIDRPPSDSRPMPSRSRWGAFRNWIGF